jgi:hypothetical protein
MIDIPGLDDQALQGRLNGISKEFSGRVTIIYEHDSVIRVELSDRMNDHGFPRDGGVNDAALRRRFQQLPRGFYGRVALHFHAGVITGVEVTESLKPRIDRTRVPFAK